MNAKPSTTKSGWIFWLFWTCVLAAVIGQPVCWYFEAKDREADHKEYCALVESGVIPNYKSMECNK